MFSRFSDWRTAGWPGARTVVAGVGDRATGLVNREVVERTDRDGRCEQCHTGQPQFPRRALG